MQEFHSPRNYLKSALSKFQATKILSSDNNNIENLN